jgi:FixJ family two-component response regulator
MNFTPLTPRQRDVLRLVPSGMRNKQITKRIVAEARMLQKWFRGCSRHPRFW